MKRSALEHPYNESDPKNAGAKRYYERFFFTMNLSMTEFCINLDVSQKRAGAWVEMPREGVFGKMFTAEKPLVTTATVDRRSTK